jgi:asparagine synthase (glutamine-hydrolysing)
LSGGLDSSTVLACLKSAGLASRVTCLTYTQGESSELDEIRYARAAARAAGVELVEAELRPGRMRLDRASARAMEPRPLGYTFSIENDDIERDVAESCGAEACFTGAGGDGLFFQLRARTYCADYLMRHGLSLGALGVAYDNARLARVSFWTALREGFRLAYGREAFDPEASPRNPYLAADLGDPARGWLDAHPWFRAAPNLSPGKRLHLWAVLDCLNLFYPYRRAEIADTEFALITQPVIETVLRIPSWILTSGGRDRSLLREAFAGEAPDLILARGGKGAMDGYYAEICAANADHLRERLLDGALARQGLLDRASLERDLPRSGEPRDGRELILLRLFAAEVWASEWARAPQLA